MGRPINKKFIGNTGVTGQQIAATAWIPGQGAPYTDAYITRQTGTGRYVMRANAGVASGQVSLVNGALTTAGQANIVVTPWGAGGSGATVAARLGLGAVAVNLAGKGPVGDSYLPSEKLSVIGGTRTATGNVTVNSVKIGNVTTQNAGTGYGTNSYLIFSGTDWTTSGNVQVATIGGGGAITGLTIINAGVFVGTSLPGTGGLSVAPTSVIGTQGSSATVNFRFDINGISVTDTGVYSVIPSNPIALAASAEGGAGANVNVTWSVTQVAVTYAGDGLYTAADVDFETGAAAATATVTTGNISAVTVTAGGSYSAVPNVSISGSTSKEYAAVIFDNTVRTFTNNRTYDWKFEGIPLTAPGQATIQSD
jgi:hypothetical protein